MFTDRVVKRLKLPVANSFEWQLIDTLYSKIIFEFELL